MMKGLNEAVNYARTTRALGKMIGAIIVPVLLLYYG